MTEHIPGIQKRKPINPPGPQRPNTQPHRPVPAPVHTPLPPRPAPTLGGGTGGTRTTATPSLTSDQQSVYDLMNSTLASWGLSALSGDLKNFIVKGDTNPDTLALALSQTDAYKQRFAANAIREAKGLPDLKPADYIALEEQYRNVLSSYGLPSGFYDSKDDFTQFIGNDISPSELQARAQIAHDQYMAAPDYVKNLWSQYFGTQGDAIAAILDPNTATQIIQDRAQQVGIGGAAAAHGLNINQPRAQQLQEAGVTLDQARQAYQKIALALPTDQEIAQRFGTTFKQSDEENDLLLGDASAARQRQTMYAEEQGLFHENAGADQNSLSISQEH